MLTRVLPESFRGELGTEGFWVADVKASDTPKALLAASKLEERPSTILKRVMKTDDPKKSAVLLCRLALATKDHVEKTLLTQGVETAENIRVLLLVNHVPVMEVCNYHPGWKGYGRVNLASSYQDQGRLEDK